MSGYCTVHGQYSGSYCESCRQNEEEERELREQQRTLIEEQRELLDQEAWERMQEQDEDDIEEEAEEFERQLVEFSRKAKKRRCHTVKFPVPKRLSDYSSSWNLLQVEKEEIPSLGRIRARYDFEYRKALHDSIAEDNGGSDVLTSEYLWTKLVHLMDETSPLEERSELDKVLERLELDDRLISTGVSERVFVLTATLQDIQRCTSEHSDNPPYYILLDTKSGRAIVPRHKLEEILKAGYTALDKDFEIEVGDHMLMTSNQQEIEELYHLLERLQTHSEKIISEMLNRRHKITMLSHDISESEAELKKKRNIKRTLISLGIVALFSLLGRGCECSGPDAIADINSMIFMFFFFCGVGIALFYVYWDSTHGETARHNVDVKKSIENLKNEILSGAAS